MRQSHYNFFFKLEDDRHLAYNSRMNGLAVIDSSTRDAIIGIDEGPGDRLSPELLGELKVGGFVVDDELDELRALVVKRHMAQYSTNSLGLTIAPTLSCNLACTYCYEMPDRAVMSESTQEAIVDHVRRSIEAGIKRLGVTWYGGEPLLCFDVIERLSQRLIQLCQEHQVSYEAAVVTNGTLLSRTIAERLKEIKVGNLQITIDGDQPTHDQRRPYVGGAGSFSVITRNLAAAAGIVPIVIRANLDASNADSALAFFNQLKAEPWFTADAFTFYYGHVRKYTSSCRCNAEECLQQSDFFAKELELHEHMRKAGYGYSHYPMALRGCGATSLTSLVIGPKGELYKCWNDVGLAEREIGNVQGDRRNESLEIEYLTSSFEDDPECHRCKVLPICMGGCVDIRIKAGKGELDSKSCSQWRYYLEQSLRSFYVNRVRETNGART